MDIAIKKVELIEWLAKLQDKKVIKKVESLKNQSIKSSYEAKLKPMSSKAYKAISSAVVGVCVGAMSDGITNNPLLLFVIDCCCGSPDPQRGIICGSSY